MSWRSFHLWLQKTRWDDQRGEFPTPIIVNARQVGRGRLTGRDIIDIHCREDPRSRLFGELDPSTRRNRGIDVNHHRKQGVDVKTISYDASQAIPMVCLVR
jgi:hypothetical protein